MTLNMHECVGHVRAVGGKVAGGRRQRAVGGQVGGALQERRWLQTGALLTANPVLHTTSLNAQESKASKFLLRMR